MTNDEMAAHTHHVLDAYKIKQMTVQQTEMQQLQDNLRKASMAGAGLDFWTAMLAAMQADPTAAIESAFPKELRDKITVLAQTRIAEEVILRLK